MRHGYTYIENRLAMIPTSLVGAVAGIEINSGTSNDEGVGISDDTWDYGD